jgi:uncharacterized protein (UPF0332 family)
MAAFDWSQYLVLAKELGARSEEAALRSAVSRAYYAAYNTAKSFCDTAGVPIIDSGNLHRDLWTAFLKRGGRTFTSVYDKGERLRRKRTRADYDSEIFGLTSMAADSIRDADAIRSFLKS